MAETADSGKMKALVKEEEKESYVLKDIDIPVPKGDEVLIRVDAASICGSDIALYKWDHVAQMIASVPFIPGHECAGTVVQTGPEATLKIGARIAVENHFYCGECFQCTNGRGDICAKLGQYGHGLKTMHGACSKFSIVPSKYCYQLTTDISADEAVLLEPFGVAHNALERLEVSGEDILVIGCGPIGLLATAAAKHMGARRVLAADIDESRLKLAGEMGADVMINTATSSLKDVVMKETANVGIGRIAEMSGSPVMANSMFSLLRKGGQVVMVGLVKQPLHIENVLQDIVFKSLTLRSVHGRRIFHSWRETERLVAEKKVDVTKIISHRFPLDEFESAFSTLFSGKACKIVLYPSEMP